MDRLRTRLRTVVGLVAPQQRRPRILSLEGIKPLCLGTHLHQIPCLSLSILHKPRLI